MASDKTGYSPSHSTTYINHGKAHWEEINI